MYYMKKLFFILLSLLNFGIINAAEQKIIRISTDNTDLILQVGDNGRLYQTYLGERLLQDRKSVV